jgi:transposase
MSKTTRARYTLEFKLEAVRLVEAGQSVATVAATLDVPAQSISNAVKAEQKASLAERARNR